jgi:hypothetical protein
VLTGESVCLGMQAKLGCKLHLKLNTLARSHECALSGDFVSLACLLCCDEGSCVREQRLQAVEAGRQDADSGCRRPTVSQRVRRDGDGVPPGRRNFKSVCMCVCLFHLSGIALCLASREAAWLTRTRQQPCRNCMCVQRVRR